jgi:hypothetical protein
MAAEVLAAIEASVYRSDVQKNAVLVDPAARRKDHCGHWLVKGHRARVEPSWRPPVPAV